MPRLLRLNWCIALALLHAQFALGATAEIGHRAPQVSLPMLAAAQAQRVDLSAYQGRVVYIDFWASWCGPCRTAFPILEQLYREFHPLGFEILAINVDEFEQDASEFLASHPVSYIVVRDDTGVTPQRYGILGMPTGFLLDREGVIRVRHEGFRRSDGEALRAAITQLLDSHSE